MHDIVLMEVLNSIANTIKDAFYCLFVTCWVLFNVIKKSCIFSIFKHNIGSLCVLIEFIIIDFYDVGMF